MGCEPLYVCMTMDVERLTEHSPTGGPTDWAFAARSVQSYCGLLTEYQLPATLFVQCNLLLLLLHLCCQFAFSVFIIIIE